MTSRERVTDLGHPVPDSFAGRLDVRLALLDRRRRRRWAIGGAATAAVALLAAVGLFKVVSDRALARDAETAARALGGLVDQGQLEAAKKHPDRLRQGISRSAAVAAAAERLRMRTAEEPLRRAGNLSKDLKDSA